MNDHNELLFPEAIYRPASLSEHIGNPLVEALPPFHSSEEIIDQFGKFPLFSDSESMLPAPIRMLAISRLNNYLEPLTVHYEIIEKINLIVRSGYTHRNPINQQTKKELVTFYRQAMEGEIRPIGQSFPSTAPSFALFGVSGVGKTTAVEQALSFLPQVLIHKEHKFTQIVWMKLDCPPDGSLKQLLLALLAYTDSIFKTSYRKEIGREPVIDKLILAVAKICSMHHLGVLVIDEIQNLLDASGVSQAIMLNFFVTFANIIKIPLIVVGTPRALTLLEGTFREARRIGDHGTCIWDRLLPGPEWDFFLEGLWKYQWTTKLMPLDERVSSLMYERTQGIHALVVRLFQLAQLQAIRDEIECLTVELIEEVANQKFKLVEPMLAWLKGNAMDNNGKNKGKNNDSKHYEDLLIHTYKYFDKEIDQQSKLAKLGAKKRLINQQTTERLRTLSALIALGYKEEEVDPIVKSFFDNDTEMSSNKAVRMILESQKRLQEKDVLTEGPTLKDMVDAAVKNGEIIIDALASAGIIADV